MVRVTSKGQVTIPVAIRRALELKAGDGLLFEPLEKDMARFRVVRRRGLTEFAGALRAKRRYPGKAALREEVGRTLGQELVDRVEPKP
ncbi:MAG: AbrB/MazE/SpoVT family DNA-binding domain-containing protein [bacterium]|nr:AbrB/MazE/SpoVT family DNA-binding domain-containing protein [bacterium]